jgi:hypothetical protein
MAGLTGHAGGNGAGMTTGRQVFEMIDDLIRECLPLIPLDDPGRSVLAALSPQMSATLGRSPIRAVIEED